ncbi:extracellular solute-binding protein [Paenibacillus sp. GCM10012303]|uniref:extracellular solute-binding protein n=1 Tax=Paenibacillus sp. GCM10012303 TaxID=3317340 RepID=UPI003615B64C
MKKWGYGVLALALAGATAACGKEENAAQQSAGEAGKPVAIEVERWVSVSVDVPPPEQDVVLQTIRKDLGIDLKYAFSSGKSDEWRAKLGARIAANDLPEAILFFNMADYRKAQEQGYLLPMNEVLKPNALPPNLKYATKEMLYTISDKNGVYHGIPARPPTMTNSLFIRKDWLDRLNLKMPTTTDELKAVMQAFAGNDPDGNGKKDTFGFSASGSSMNGQPFWQLLSAFTGDVRGSFWVDQAGKLKGGPVSGEFRHYLQYMNELMKSGAIDPDLATNNLDRVTQKAEQGQIGIFHNTGYPNAIVQNMKKLNPQAEVVLLPPITGPAGKASNNGKTNSPNGILSLTVKLKDQPEKVNKMIELANWMNGQQGARLLTFGIEGLNHKKTNGVITEFIAGSQSNYLSAYSIMGEPAIKTAPETVKVFYPDAFLYEQQMKLIGDNPEIGGIFAMGQAKEPTQYAADLSKYVTEMMLKFIYGNVPLDDKNWDEYVNAYLTKYKGQQYLDEIKRELTANGYLK